MYSTYWSESMNHFLLLHLVLLQPSTANILEVPDQSERITRKVHYKRSSYLVAHSDLHTDYFWNLIWMVMLHIGSKVINPRCSSLDHLPKQTWKNKPEEVIHIQAFHMKSQLVRQHLYCNTCNIVCVLQVICFNIADCVSP